jgi:hypothetical protein
MRQYGKGPVFCQTFGLNSRTCFRSESVKSPGAGVTPPNVLTPVSAIFRIGPRIWPAFKLGWNPNENFQASHWGGNFGKASTSERSLSKERISWGAGGMISNWMGAVSAIVFLISESSNDVPSKRPRFFFAALQVPGWKTAIGRGLTFST